MTDHTDTIDFEDESETKTATPDAPAAHQPSDEAGIADPVRRAVERQVPGINTEFIEFPSLVSPQTDEDGRMFIEDKRGVVRYYLNSGTVEVTENHTERNIVANNNQRAVTIEEMSGMR